MRRTKTDTHNIVRAKARKGYWLRLFLAGGLLGSFGVARADAQPLGDDLYRFDVEIEACVDESRKMGLNKKFVGECGDVRKMKFEMRNYQGANFMGADMRKSVFRMSNLSSTNLQFADLRKADLRSSELKGANLGRSDLRKAKLNAADFSRASLIGVDLRGADLSGAVFRRSKIINSDLRDTTLELVDLRDTILRQVLLPEDIDPNILPANYRPISEAEFSLELVREKNNETLPSDEGVSLLEQLLRPLVDDDDREFPETVEEEEQARGRRGNGSSSGADDEQ